MLSSLKIDPLITKRKQPASANSTPNKKRAKATPAHGSVPAKQHATRASARLNGRKLEPEELEVKMKEEEALDNRKANEKERLKHSDRLLVAESWRMKDGDPEKLTHGLFESLSPSLFKSQKTMKQEEINMDYQTGSDHEYDRLVEELDGLRLKALNKVCPNRIYCLTFHPTIEKNLVFAGDKLGGIAVWDTLAGPLQTDPNDEGGDDPKSIVSTKHLQVKAVKKEDDVEEMEDEEEPVEGRSFFIQAHSGSAISCIQTHPTNLHLLYSSSYDSTVRELNFETKQSTEVLAGNALSAEEILFSAFEFANEGREIWCSDNSGGLSHRDLREVKQKARRWEVSKKKIGCVSLCPNSNDRWAVTAGLNREMR